jgi:hypothetical protein
MMIAALARLTDGRSSCLALETFEDAKDPAAECKYRGKGRRQTQKDQSRALAMIILALFLSFFLSACPATPGLLLLSQFTVLLL